MYYQPVREMEKKNTTTATIQYNKKKNLVICSGCQSVKRRSHYRGA